MSITASAFEEVTGQYVPSEGFARAAGDATEEEAATRIEGGADALELHPLRESGDDRRKLSWAMAAWSAAAAAWIVFLVARGGSHCVHERFRAVCETDSDVQKGIGVVLVGSLWLLGFLVLAATWLLTRRRGWRSRRPGERG